MSTTRRDVLLAAAAVGAASAPGASQAAGKRRRLLIDAERAQGPSPAGAVIIPAGVFLDPGFLGASPAGDYEARLTPANRFLLLEALRHARIAHEASGDVLLFRKPSAKAG